MGRESRNIFAQSCKAGDSGLSKACRFTLGMQQQRPTQAVATRID
jgi:hypothetical protein